MAGSDEMVHRQPLSTDTTYYAPKSGLVEKVKKLVSRQVSTPTYYAPKTRVVHPVAGESRISQRPSAGHMGYDFGAAVGTPVVASTASMVSRIQRTPGKGYGFAVFMIDLKTGLEWTYAHLGGIGVKVGQVFKPGEQIGVVGEHEGGSHLHLEVGAPGADPFYGKMTEQGAVDPTPYLEGAAIGSMVGLIPGTIAGTLPGLIPPLSEPSYRPSGKNGSIPMSGITSTGVVVDASEPEKEFTGMFAAFERMGASAGEGVKRAGFISAGLFIILLGIILLAFSFRDEIGGAAKTGVKTVAKGAAVAGTGGAATPVVAAVV